MSAKKELTVLNVVNINDSDKFIIIPDSEAYSSEKEYEWRIINKAIEVYHDLLSKKDVVKELSSYRRLYQGIGHKVSINRISYDIRYIKPWTYLMSLNGVGIKTDTSGRHISVDYLKEFFEDNELLYFEEVRDLLCYNKNTMFDELTEEDKSNIKMLTELSVCVNLSS